MMTANSMTDSLIVASRLGAEYRQNNRWHPVLRNISLRIGRGEVVGLAGESGSGKSTLGSLLMGEQMPNRRVVAGQVDFDGYDMHGAHRDGVARLHGKRIGFVPQNDGNALTPTLRIRGHFAETLRRHVPGLNAAAIRARTIELLRRVGIPAPEAVLDRYPHQFSGGQQQRISLALALSTRPDLLILDEPTTGQDAVIRRGIVRLLREIAADGETSMLFVSHDLATLAELCTRIVVMKSGEIVEDGPTAQVIGAPHHPYTQALVAALPRIDVAPAAGAQPDRAVSGTDVLSLDNVTFRYDPTVARPTLDAVSLRVRAGETLALVGESGSGKSTLLRIVAGLVQPQSGEIRFDGAVTDFAASRRGLDARRRMQIIFQNPDRSLNPQHRVGKLIGRPLELFFGMRGKERDCEVARLLEDVQLPPEFAERYTSELSGGQKQRVAIARALAAKPTLLLCDEVISALDVSIQVQILDLLRKIRRETGMAMLFVTHDLAVVRWFADRIAILYHGKLIEEADAAALDHPESLQPYTRELLSAVPRMSTRGEKPEADDRNQT